MAGRVALKESVPAAGAAAAPVDEAIAPVASRSATGAARRPRRSRRRGATGIGETLGVRTRGRGPERPPLPGSPELEGTTTVDYGKVRPMTAAEMTPGWHAERTPETPAIVMGSSGEAVTYAQLEERSVRFARALRSLGVGVGDHIAILMENNARYLEVAWAAQRSGLYYTAINTHLRPGEVQYILDDCGAVALVASSAMAELVAGLDLSRIGVLVSAVGELPGFQAYGDLVAGEEPGPLEDECEGREMLYSSGTTGRPKGVRKQLPGTPLGDPASAPVIVAQGIARMGAEDVVYLCPAPLYHSAP